MAYVQRQFYSQNSYEKPVQSTLYQKIKAAKRIVTSKDISTYNFFDLIDNDKLIAIDVNEMNYILDSGCFSLSEKDYIRELRRKTMNRKTAKLSRIRDKQEYQELNVEVAALSRTKMELTQEREALMSEVNFYQKLININ